MNIWLTILIILFVIYEILVICSILLVVIIITIKLYCYDNKCPKCHHKNHNDECTRMLKTTKPIYSTIKRYNVTTLHIYDDQYISEYEILVCKCECKHREKSIFNKIYPLILLNCFFILLLSIISLVIFGLCIIQMTNFQYLPIRNPFIVCIIILTHLNIFSAIIVSACIYFYNILHN